MPGLLLGASSEMELVLLVDAGLTTEESLAAATISPARAIGRGTSKGRSSEESSLISSCSTPTLADIHNIGKVHLVFKGGAPNNQTAGLLAGHIRKAAREYGSRYLQIVEVLDRRFAKWLEVVPGAAGLHVAALLRTGCAANMTQVVRRAARRGVRVETLAGFFAGPVSREGLVIGYGAIPTSRIDDGLALLKESWDSRS